MLLPFVSWFAYIYKDSSFIHEQIVSQHNARNYKKSKVASNLKWEMSSEPIPTADHLPVDSKIPKELYSLLKDTTDYAWYTTK